MRMKRESSIESLLQQTQDELKIIEKTYQSYSDSTDILEDVPDNLKIKIQDFLGHNKAILDYLAQEIATLCNPKPKRPYFPIANRTKSPLEFQNDLNRWFPGLHSTKPMLFDFLLSIQYFHDSPWLLEFSEIINFNKHDMYSYASSLTLSSENERIVSSGRRPILRYPWCGLSVL